MLNRRVMKGVVATVAGAILALPALAQEIVAKPTKASGVYEVNEKITWAIELKGVPDKVVPPADLRYVLKRGGFTVMKEGTLPLKDGQTRLETSMAEPGTILAELRAKVGDKEIKWFAGAAVSPKQIELSAPRPDDFDAFWKAKVDELNAIPANPKLEPADAGKDNVEYFKLTMDNIKGSRVYGQLAKPKKEGKYPALLIVQYAGVYGLPKSNVVNRAAQGWLALNIMAHDLPFDQPAEFYADKSKKELNNYMAIGNTDRETSYFLRMYLSCYRAAEYLATRDDWDGKTLVVTGTSQGGQQTLVTAGLHPKITAMIANVPAGCDVTGQRVGRAIGFPYWANEAKWKKNDKIVEVGRYFDAANFTQRASCPSLVALGLIDETCPPAGVYAAFNQLKGPKEVVVMPLSDHQGKRQNAQAAFYSRSEAWLRALVKGDPAPVKSTNP
jgi:cephalosporin-C deacetylase-like acetyl esterase